MATYLVTGSTGLIGRHFVQELLPLADTDTVYLLVRESSQERLARIASRWPNAEKVRTVVGDVSQPRLGIADGQLPEKIDHVVHLAALYDLTADDEASTAANVDGTRNVIELAAAIGAGCLHHVSSVAVAGDYRGKFTEEMFDAGQRLLTPYHRTKFESERLVRTQQDVPWRVYRPAIVVGNSVTGEMDKIDGPYYFFTGLARLKSLPSVPLVFPDIGDTNIVPVDYVAKALAHLVNRPGLDGRAFHLVNPEPQSARYVYNAFARAAGAPVATTELTSRLSNPLLGLVKLAEHVPGVTIVRDAVLDRLGIPPELLSTLTFEPRFASAETRKALSDSGDPGIEVPPLHEYADVLWRYWREHLDPFRARKHGGRGELDGRRVVITGASSGIGRATALKVAAAGGVPLLVARRLHELEEVRAEIEEAGGHGYVYPCDLTDGESVDKMVAQMLAEQPSVDMLVNNAGRSIRRSVQLSYDRMHDYERAMAINYFGAVRLILALLPHMVERRFGHVVNVSSIGVQGIAPRFSAYVASKAALDYFSKIVATETHGAGITFTTVHMPLVRTPMIRPTKIYDAFPTKSPEQAADMVMDALLKRPKHIGTPTGYLIQAAYTVAPGLVDAIAYQGYRIFPDSTAAGGGGRVKIGKGDRHLSAAATALARLTRGFHW